MSAGYLIKSNIKILPWFTG